MTAPGERRSRLVGLLGGADQDSGTRVLCDVAAAVTACSGAGIMLMAGGIQRGSVCTTDPVAALIEDLQFDLLEGPCVAAYDQDVPVLEPDLADPAAARWPAFSEPALAAGVRAVFGFPLHIGRVRLGALNLYRDKPGRLSPDGHADALVLADLAAQTILMMQAGAPPGSVAAELEVNADFHYAVHQATGMVAAQLQIPVSDALVRLRAHAFASGAPLLEVSRAVVARRLRLDADPVPDGPTA